MIRGENGEGAKVRELTVFLRTQAKLASNISIQIETHTLPQIILELSKSILVFSFFLPSLRCCFQMNICMEVIHHGLIIKRQ